MYQSANELLIEPIKRINLPQIKLYHDINYRRNGISRFSFIIQFM